MNQFNIKRYQLSYLPTVSLSGNYSKNAQRKEFDFLEMANGLALLLWV